MSETPNDPVSVELTRNEIAVLCNALGEVLGGVEHWEFSSRIGSEVVDAEGLRTRLRDYLPDVTPPQT